MCKYLLHNFFLFSKTWKTWVGRTRINGRKRGIALGDKKKLCHAHKRGPRQTCNWSKLVAAYLPVARRTILDRRLVYLRTSCSSRLACSNFRIMKSRARLSSYRVSGSDFVETFECRFRFSNKGLGLSASLGFNHSPPLQWASACDQIIKRNLKMSSWIWFPRYSDLTMVENSCLTHLLLLHSNIKCWRIQNPTR